MKKFEYKEISKGGDYDSSYLYLNGLGEEGWELCSVLRDWKNPNKVDYFFKREIINGENESL